MGSVWCKPNEMREDCSPKLNIHSLISRLTLQMCPSKCRNPQTSSRLRTKPRPRSAVLSQGKRPEISPPFVHPIPPPRKKRKHLQDMSRSEEILCSQEIMNPALRTSASLPSVYDPHSIILRNAIDIKPPMASIMEESPNINHVEIVETETESLPPSEVYFLKKEEIPKVFSEAKSADEIAENDEYLNNKKPMSDTFSASSDTVLRIDKIKEKDKLTNEETKKITEDLKMISDENSSDNKLNLVKDETNIESTKKWQDAMKTRWLQNILIEGEPKDINNQVTVNGSLHVNTCISSEDKSSFEKSDNKNILKHASDKIGNQNSLIKSQNQMEEQKDDKAYENVVKHAQEQIPKVLVTPKSLSETLERLQNTQQCNQNNVHNNRNLVFSSDNLNNLNNLSPNSKRNKELKLENKKDSLKLDFNLEEKLQSNRNSRHSSITDSLQEFETSIYDMLQQSAKENVSDEDDSLVIMNVNNKNNNINNTRNESAQTC